MAITKVWLDETENECTMCGACEAVCDTVFEVPEKMVVKTGADFSKYESEIKEAVDGCPVNTIAYAVDGSDKRANK
jgi:ferredoxin